MSPQSSRGPATETPTPERANDPSGPGARRNIRLLLAYDGTDFHGWQRQPGLPTLQALLEDTIGRICRKEVSLYGSGRTDAGVHALGQVSNFVTSCRIPCANLMKALNDLLPPTVRVREAKVASPEFHARYDVRSKTYRYRIVRTAISLPFISRFAWHYSYPLDVGRMAEAARLLTGEHDFTSFAAAGLPGEEPAAVRTIFSSRFLWRPRTEILTYEVQGDGFLHHMVRNIVGTLIEVGRGKLTPQQVERILKARDRTLAGPTAPAQGLCLMRVDY